MRCDGPLSTGKAPNFQGDDRLLASYLAGLGDEIPSIADSFQVKRKHTSERVSRHWSQYIGFVYVCLVAQTYQARESKALAARPVDDRRAYRA